MNDATTRSASNAEILERHGTWFGHPAGLSTLFFTEMWERFSYYGMRALLALYMTTATTHVILRGDGSEVANPGMGLDVGTAAAIYGLYTSLVYIMALPGGWIADNLWGQRKAVWVGGWIIALGHFTMAVPSTFAFFLGLVFVVLGTGLLKPNVSTIVGELYPEGGARRDAGFSIFYMGINVGALLGPLITSFLAEGYNWHWGFGAAGVGMVLGLIQYRNRARLLGEAGLLTTEDGAAQLAAKSRRFFGSFFAVIVGVVAFGYLVSTGVIPATLAQIATVLGYGVLIIIAAYFVYLWTAGGHTREENRRLGVIFWLFLLIAVFWSGFEQAGSSLNLFGRDYTDRNILGWLMPAGFLQSVNSFFIILLAPVFGSLWVWLERRNRNPSIPDEGGPGTGRAGDGVLRAGLGRSERHDRQHGEPVLAGGDLLLPHRGRVVHLAHRPVGHHQAVARANRVGQMMGVWFVGAALGNLFAGLVAGQLVDLAPGALFQNVAMTIGIVGIVGLLAAPWVKRLTGGKS